MGAGGDGGAPAPAQFADPTLNQSHWTLFWIISAYLGDKYVYLKLPSIYASTQDSMIIIQAFMQYILPCLSKRWESNEMYLLSLICSLV